MSWPAEPTICWLCRYGSEQAFCIERVWLCATCIKSLAAFAMRHDRLRQQAAQKSHEEHRRNKSR
jgi:hypothetical protein